MFHALVHTWKQRRFWEVMVDKSVSMVFKESVINKLISDACSIWRSNFGLKFKIVTPLKNLSWLTHYYLFCSSLFLPLISSSCALFCFYFPHFVSFSFQLLHFLVSKQHHLHVFWLGSKMFSVVVIDLFLVGVKDVRLISFWLGQRHSL